MISAASEAAESARLDSIENRDRIGVSLGYHGENPSVEDLLLLYRYWGRETWDINGLTRDGVYSFFNFFRRKPDVATSILSILFDCKGSNLTIVSACAAGAQAIGEAPGDQRGKSRRDDRGRVRIQPEFYGFCGVCIDPGALRKYSSPEKASRPFDRKRNGFVMSEGAGALVLESLDSRRAKGPDFR